MNRFLTSNGGGRMTFTEYGSGNVARKWLSRTGPV